MTIRYYQFLFLGFFIVLILGFSVEVVAQQRPQYTQYIINNYIINPAITGIENYVDIRIGRRNQWVSLSDAPVTTYISAHTPIGGGYLRGNVNSSAGSGENPFSRSYLQSYRAAEPHHGVGVIAVFDKVGPFNRTDVAATYAYHLGITPKINMSVGIAPGVTLLNLDLGKVSTSDPNDPAIGNNANSKIMPDMSAGIWIYGAQFFIGASGQQLIPQKLSFTTNTNYSQGQLVPHWFATAGYKFSFWENIAFQPSVMIKEISGTPLSIDANLKTSFSDRMWLGVSYRKNDSFSILAGINPTYFLNISYSYDMTSSALSVVSQGTHEIVLGILLNNRYQASCPKKMW